MMLFEETWQRHRELIRKDALVLVEGLVRFDEFSDGWRLSARRISDLDQVREQEARRLVIRCAHRAAAGWHERLAAILAPWRPGPCPITIEYQGEAACGALTLGADWTVRASRELLEQLEGLLGRDAVQVLYGPPPAAAAAGSFFADSR
jgi:DNA polymerase-3 subunit alpha